MLEAYWLTDKNKFKRFYDLKKSTNDALIEELIDSASELIESHCGGKRFANREYDKKFNGTGTRFLVLNEYPITKLTTVYSSDSEITDCEIDDSEVQIRRGEHLTFSAKTRNIRVIWEAGYATIPTDLTLACNMIVGYFFRKHEEHSVGVSSKSASGGNITYFGPTTKYSLKLPGEVLAILERYTRRVF